MNRLEQLEKMLKETPNDPFLIYGMALEYRNTNIKLAKEKFDYLLATFPDYLPCYYQAGALYEEIDEDRAVLIYSKGMDLSKQQNNMHSYGELKSALELLQF